jgi:predicted N-acetyltransferase YhbS
LAQYGQVLWKGFNHELDGEGPFVMTEEKEKAFSNEMYRENVNLELKVAVVNPEGNFVSYCGMWYDEEAGFAVIEPVATDPKYRKMGLGKAAVLEGIKRVAKLGAKKVIVGSSQQFYYSIGMRPYRTATKWIYRTKGNSESS